MRRKPRKGGTGLFMSQVNELLMNDFDVPCVSLSPNLHFSLFVRAEDGEFELKKPPKPDENKDDQFAEAVAESVEQAMEQKVDSDEKE